MASASLVPFTLVLALAGVAVAQKPIVASVTQETFDPRNQDRTKPPAIAPDNEQVVLAAAPSGAGVAKLGLADAWGGAVEVGGKSRQIVVGKSAEGLEVPDVIVVDLDGDGAFGDAERMVLATTKREVRGNTVVMAEPLDLEFTAPGGSIDAKATFAKSGERDPSVSILFPNFLSAPFELDGAKLRIGLVDRDRDGKFGTAGDMWAVSEVGKASSEYVRNLMKERTLLNGSLFGIEFTGDAVRISSKPSKSLDAASAVAQRERAEHVWTKRFDAERAGFVEAQKLDTSRALAKKPIEWRYVSFDEACAMAKKENKLLFVDVMAFWCVWCYRMDYYTYPDQEVAQYMTEHYIPVKILQEQDAAGDYERVRGEKLGARGIPAMGVFDADGNVLHKISGWSKPEAFLGEMQAGVAAAKH